MYEKQLQIFRVVKHWKDGSTYYEKWYNDYNFVAQERERITKDHQKIGYIVQTPCNRTSYALTIVIECSYVTVIPNLDEVPVHDTICS